MKRSDLAAIGVLLVATVAVGWPWSLTWNQAMLPRDTAFTLVQMQHLRGAPSELASSPLGWPLWGSVAQADWVWVQAWLQGMLPIDPHLAHNALVLLGWFATAWACHKAAEVLLGPGPHTWTAGVVGGLGPVQLAHAQHLNLVHHEVAVLAPLALGVGLLGDRPRWAAAGGALAWLGVHLGVYVGLHGLVAAAIVALCSVGRGSRRTWLAAAAGAALGALTVVPVAWVYAAHAAQYAVELQPGDVANGSVDLRRVLAPVRGVVLHNPLQRFWLPNRQFTPVNPGYIALLLAVPGAWMAWRARSRAWLAVALVGTVSALIALGPELIVRGPTGWPAPGLLVSWTGLRGWDRFLAMSCVAVGLFAAAGVKQVRWGWAVALLPLLEVGLTKTDPLAMLEPHPIYAAIPDGSGPVWDQALGERRIRCSCRHHQPLVAALRHGRPVLGGEYARSPSALVELNRVAADWPHPDTIELFGALGVAVTVEHEIRGPAPGVCAADGRHRVCKLEPVPRPATALRWDAVPRRVVLACGDERRPVRLRPWLALTRARYGEAGPALEVWADGCTAEGAAAGPVGDWP